jgi:hypothetical protein
VLLEYLMEEGRVELRLEDGRLKYVKAQ